MGNTSSFLPMFISVFPVTVSPCILLPISSSPYLRVFLSPRHSPHPLIGIF